MQRFPLGQKVSKICFDFILQFRKKMMRLFQNLFDKACKMETVGIKHMNMVPKATYYSN